ncbi:MAG: hypothetical protein M3Y56_09850 [Armatimonadota bacterium]|nr:hypothetical protein [Armatimonadota bacterium]
MQRRALARTPGIAALLTRCCAVSVVAVVTCSLGGCARYPATVQGTTPSLLLVTMQLRGQINPAYYYFVALQASPTTSAQDAHPESGPFAIVQADQGVSGWGNGWGAGKITDYVLFHNNQATQFTVNCSNLSACPANVAAGGQAIGPPFSTFVSSGGGTGGANSLVVAVDLSKLGLNGTAAGTSTTGARPIPGGVVVNTITTDHLETVVTNPPKPVDSLDQGGMLPPLVDTHQSKIINITPPGGVLFPNSSVITDDLQLTQVTLEVRLPQ